MLDPKLLEILACPVCGASLRFEDEGLICTATQVRFPVEHGIPILLSDRAQPQHPVQVDEQTE